MGYEIVGFSNKLALVKAYTFVLLFSLLEYVVLISIFTALYASGYHVCKSDWVLADRPLWLGYANFGEICGFGTFSAILMMKIFNFHGKRNMMERLVAYSTALFINVVSLTSSILSFSNETYHCKNNFKISTPLSMWIEWTVCVPLIVFFSITVNDSIFLSKNNIYLIFSMYLCIVFGFLCQFDISFHSEIVLIAFSWIAYAFALYFCYTFEKAQFAQVVSPQETISTNRQQIEYEWAAATKNVRTLLLVVMPTFPLVYTLGMAGVINSNDVYVGLMLCNLISKVGFVSMLLDSHISLMDSLVTIYTAEQSANVSRTAFLRYVFHEIRNPLNSLALGLNILKLNSALNAEETETIMMMHGSVTYMSDTLNDVLYLHKIETGELQIMTRNFALADSIIRASKAAKYHVSSKSIKVFLDIKSSVPHIVHGDRMRLEHALTNIIASVLKFSQENAVIRLMVFATPTNELDTIDTTFIVEDSGAGIPRDELDLLFQPFNRLRPSDVQRAQGTGLGLVIAKNIIELLGGTMSITNSPTDANRVKLGFTVPFEADVSQFKKSDYMSSSNSEERPSSPVRSFRAVPNNNNNNNNNNSRVKIPDALTVVVAKSENMDPAVASNIINDTELQELNIYTDKNRSKKAESVGMMPEVDILSVHTSEPPKRTRKKHLIVDDTSSNRKMLAMLLQRKGMEVDMAENGLKGVEAVQQNIDLYELIFMDNTMPVMNGIDATRMIRELGYNGLIFGLTGNALDEDVRGFLSAGAEIVLAKPLRAQQLEAIIMFIEEYGCISDGKTKLCWNGDHLEKSKLHDITSIMVQENLTTMLLSAEAEVQANMKLE